MSEQAIDRRLLVGPRLAADSWTMAWRLLKATPRQPELLMFSTIQTIMFVLLFRYVFGGAIETGGIPFVQFLMPGIFVQTLAFNGAVTTVGHVAAGIVLILLFSFAFSWIGILIGLSVKSVEAAQSGGFIWQFPLTFASAAFVPVERMPGWLQAFAKYNPITLIVNALRGWNAGHCGAGDCACRARLMR